MKGSRRGLALACFMATMSSIENLSVEQLHKINTWKKFVDERPWSAVRDFYEGTILDEASLSLGAGREGR